MSTIFRRAGLLLGALGIVCASNAQADDFRPAQALIESGLFISQAEADAVYARLDAPRPTTDRPIPGTAAYWESGAVGLGQSERAGRLGWSGDATQMRIGVDRELRAGMIAGASAAASIGGVGSADLKSRIVAGHADIYARFDEGAAFAKTDLGVSSFTFEGLSREGSTAIATGQALRAGGQFGATADLGGIKWTPTVALTATGHALNGFRESGQAAAQFAARQAMAATATVRLGGTKAVRVDPSHTVTLSGFVGADEVVAYAASALKARSAAAGSTSESLAAPNGRGLVGGLGIGTALDNGMTFKVDYDYGRRDGVATQTGRAKIGLAF